MPAVTTALQQELIAPEEVIGLSVQLRASKKPAGDVLIVHVLNRGADEVLRRARAAVPDAKSLSVVTSEAISFIAPADHYAVDDRDEAIWEEICATWRWDASTWPWKGWSGLGPIGALSWHWAYPFCG